MICRVSPGILRALRPSGLSYMRKFLVAGNWKMNGDSAANSELVGGIISGLPQVDNIEVLVCPPFPYLAAVKGLLQGSKI